MGFPNPGQQAAQQAAQAAQQAGLQAAAQGMQAQQASLQAMQSRQGGSRSRAGSCAVAFLVVVVLAIFGVAAVVLLSLIQNGHFSLI